MAACPVSGALPLAIAVTWTWRRRMIEVGMVEGALLGDWTRPCWSAEVWSKHSASDLIARVLVGFLGCQIKMTYRTCTLAERDHSLDLAIAIAAATHMYLYTVQEFLNRTQGTLTAWLTDYGSSFPTLPGLASQDAHSFARTH